MTMLDYAPDAPTQQLDLRADALISADQTLVEVCEKLCYLADLSTVSRRFGYALPFDYRHDLAPILASVRDLVGLVRHEQDARCCPDAAVVGVEG